MAADRSKTKSCAPGWKLEEHSRQCFLISSPWNRAITVYLSLVIQKRLFISYSTTTYIQAAKRQPSESSTERGKTARIPVNYRNRSALVRRCIVLSSAERCLDRLRQLLREQPGVAGILSHTRPLLCRGPVRSPSNCVPFPSRCGS